MTPDEKPATDGSPAMSWVSARLTNARVLIRFCLRLAIILICALYAEQGYATGFAVLCLLAIAFCLLWAFLGQERVLSPHLTNWDEAAAYGCLAAFAAAIHDHALGQL